MGLSVHVEDLWHGRLDSFCDDAENSFMTLCRRMPKDSLCSGVSPYGETLFNSIQLKRLVQELDDPDHLANPVVAKVIEGALRAIPRTGYLRFIGD
ncbi:hypothetical protein [Streptomyces tanashiensis]|uniref:hypothetical protein n=1 Tax=Streptomyces tanashiensis TaxID=67367 RepID=UPI003415E420